MASPSEQRPRRLRDVARVAAQVAAGLAIVGGLGLAATRASAAFVDMPETGRPGYLQLAVDPNSAVFDGLSAGESAYWLIEARLADTESSALALQLRGWGGLVDHADGLTARVESCAVPFVGVGPDTSCGPGEVVIVDTVRLGSIATAAWSDTWVLADLARTAPRFLRVTLGVPTGAADDASLQGLRGGFAVGLFASGDSPTGSALPEPSGTSGLPGIAVLPNTGADVLAALLVAGGVVVLGLTMRRGPRDAPALAASPPRSCSNRDDS